ncbi:phenylalanine--tRNA ligase subunit beta [Chelatococcus reniformis]|uniref:Phenylalanine--tRNA ligase beta subunit n=1 Tax=Chelatococcus reniformis TaxID=1494448 RepID=A0A916UY65_9HYPH|nr:phenylalanine--tRNA ligase subunit beta [Chelatococcus reniformis]GGC93653.1 phenylalanine--tRNA ligase beta subunit [Chelatococcus reniformis]
MKFTLSWLRDHLDTSASVETIADTLTRIGLEVEGIRDPAAELAAYRVARVISAEQHPNADRLRVCMVDDGSGTPIQVVCGAPNARAGMTSVFAPPGTYIPAKDLTLAVGTIRGVESRGMLCSAFELGLSDDHDGIIDLPADAPVGQPYAAWAGLDDPVIEIAVTPNRADALGVFGIARDLAAAGLGTLKTAAIKPVPGQAPCPVGVTLPEGDDRRLCPAFALRLVRGVRNGPSPQWLQRRLADIGLRPINALVDITNYLTFDHARPLHVFDAAKVAGNLTVRRARDGEELLALDGRTYRLDPGVVVIADDDGVESLAGVMGGEHSGVSEATTDVLIEAALWDPLNIAQTGRRLGISTDARYRFERGVDPAMTLPGLELATRLVLDLCGGTPSDVVLAGEVTPPRREIAFPWSEVERLTSLSVPQADMEGILASLGFAVNGSSDGATVVPPSWRADVEGKADLVEEIVRIAGIDRVPSTPLPRLNEGVPKPVLTLLQRRTRAAKRLLAARGLVEAVTYSFIPEDEAKLFGGGTATLKLVNPIAADMSDMRPSLLPGLLKAAQRNADRGYADTALFEVGQIFASDEPGGQSISATAVRRGTARPAGTGRHWEGGGEPVSIFDAKADAFALLTALGVSTAGVQIVPGGPAWYHPGRSARLQFGPKTVIGAFGELHPSTLKALGAKGPIVACEIVLDLLPAPKARPTKVKAKLVLSDLQPVTRDFAFVVDSTVAAGDILRAVAGTDRALVADTTVFDVYEGPHVGDGRKSIAVSVRLQPTERTLTDADIEAVSTRIVEAVAKRTGATLRT